MRMMLVLGTVAALIHPAHAAPPPKDSDDWKIMQPFVNWITTQHDAMGRWGCDIGDGRPVDARISGDHWDVHITPAHFPGEQDRWMPVPDEKVTHGSNPTGNPILWLYRGQVQCFAPPDGV